MANELRIEAHLEYSKSGVKESKHDSAYVDVSGDSISKVIQEIPNSREQISVLADLGTYGYVFIKNLHASSYVQISDENDGNYFCKLKAGEFALFRAADSDYWAIAETGTVDLEIIVIED
jgi:uncharacterized protein (DUF2141 family)|tara:strand:+ start:531 stop:890 length:360 start_codon:yes stop_codon:yes gene_type:complete